MYAFSEAYLFGIHLITFYPDATLGYASVPFSVLAAMGIGYFLSRVSQESVSFAARKLLIVLVVALVVVTQSYQASITLVESKKTYFNIDEEMEEGLIWLKSNTPTDSIIFISRFAPLNGYGFITGISGRTTLSTPDPAMPAGEYIQYQRESGSQVVITLDDPEQANSILHKYSLERSAGYVFIKKDQVDWANKSFGANISLERYDTYYKKVFENVEIVIYEVF